MDIKQMNKSAGEGFGAILVEEVRERVRACRGDWVTIADMSGGMIKRSWLSAFAQGRIVSPNIILFSELAMYLGLRLGVGECRHFSDAKKIYRP